MRGPRIARLMEDVSELMVVYATSANRNTYIVLLNPPNLPAAMHLEVSALTTTIGSAWELLCYSHIFGSPLFLRLASPALSVPMKRTLEYGTYTPLTLGNLIKQYRMLIDHRNTTTRKFKMSAPTTQNIGTYNSKCRHLHSSHPWQLS